MEDIFKEIFLDIEPEKQSMNLRDVRKRLAGRIKEDDIYELCYLTQGHANNGNKEKLYSLIFDEDRRVANNALWVLTHFTLTENEWLYRKRNEMTDLAMTVTDATSRRLLLTLLNRQEYGEEDIRTDFLDFCLGRMLADAEPAGIRVLCMKLAYTMCRHHAELLNELTMALDMIPSCSSPSIMTARKNIVREMN